MNGALDIQVAGECLQLLPQRAVYWQRRKTLIVADTHFGKSSVFGMHGVAVPAGADEQDRRRIDALLAACGAEHLLILGDFLHAPLPPAAQDAQALAAWCTGLAPVRLHVVAGNHDRGSMAQWCARSEWHAGDWWVPPFRFTHDAEHASGRRGGAGGDFTLSGHTHPVMRLKGLRKLGPRIPVFWLRSHGMVLPSFGLFTGGYAVTPSPQDKLFAATADRVVAFG